MEDMPIDIHYNKLSDWLIKRRHCKQTWQEAALKIREKINTAIQDMPAHDGITKLLSGTYINYFHCQKIIEILKETEASSKNIFGSYSSQRMKDWKEIVQLYEVDCVYLAEAAQMLTRNVNYEVPALKKAVVKCKKAQTDCTRKEGEYNSLSAELRTKYTDMCHQMGIQGKQVKKELLALAANLLQTFDSIAKRTKNIKPSLDYYTQFIEFMNKSGSKPEDVCPLLRAVIDKGNITTYEWRTGRVPTSIVDTTTQNTSLDVEEEVQKANEEIDWGAIDFDEPANDDGGAEIDFGDDLDIEVNDTGNAELTIDWDDDSSQANISSTEADDNVARGKDALTVLDNPTTRFQLMDEINELETFMGQRMSEMSGGNDVIVMSLLQSAPSHLQIASEELAPMLKFISDINTELSSSKLQQLMSIRNSPRYVERMTENITKILDQADKMSASARLMIIKRQEALDEQTAAEPKIDIIKEKTIELKKQLEEEISKKYKGRIVNIMGEINAM